MKKEKTIKSLAVKGEDYELDPVTRRSRFKKNNKAALIHGGYSMHIPLELMEAITDNDLGFEVGVLKGQLSNLTLVGKTVIQELHQQGETATALSVALSCADRASKLVPQIQKALESSLVADNELSPQKQRLKNRWLKKLQAGGCTPSEVAYQFEINNLGPLPLYLIKKLETELRNEEPEIQEELYSRKELQQNLAEYWEEVQTEEQQHTVRMKAIHNEKLKVTDRFFNTMESSKKESDNGNS